MQVFEKNLLIIKNKCKLGIAIKKHNKFKTTTIKINPIEYKHNSKS